MVHCKNTFCAPPSGGDDERWPPRLIEQDKAKGQKKVMTKKKSKRGDADAEMVAAVVTTVERIERGVGVRIGDHLTPR